MTGFDSRTRDKAAEVAEDYAHRMAVSAAEIGAKGKPNIVATCKADAGATIAAAIRALPAASQGGWMVPEGYKLVPVEPTLEIIQAGNRTFWTTGSAPDTRKTAACYRAMLEAAPPPPSGGWMPIETDDAFITCVAGDGDPYVKVQFKTLQQAQSFHAAIIKGTPA